jgi:SNF2 family DNA or RNA helicase
MGQKNKVQVTNFVATGTIEHRMLSVLSFKSALAQGVLDHGEDAIFMDADKCTKFMETVEGVTGSCETQSDAIVSAEEEMEPVEMGTLFPHTIEDDEQEAVKTSETEEQTPDEEDDDIEDADIEDDEYDEYDDDDFEEDDDDIDGDDVEIEGDDDIAPVETISPPHREAAMTPSAASPEQPEPQDMLAGGLRFLSGLAQTLSSPEATERLVSSIVERDEKTGRSYMKIPIDDQQTVVNVMNMLGQLFKGFGK